MQFFMSAESQSSFSQEKDGNKRAGRIERAEKRRPSATSTGNIVLILSLFVLVTAMGSFQERCTIESMLCSL